MIIEFKQDIESGYCFTPCPYGRDCFINSVVCSECIHFFGVIKNEDKIKCTGERMVKLCAENQSV